MAILRAVARSVWDEAYEMLRAYERTGASPEDVLLYAAILSLGLPKPVTPEDHVEYALVQQKVIADQCGPE